MSIENNKNHIENEEQAEYLESILTFFRKALQFDGTKSFVSDQKELDTLQLQIVMKFTDSKNGEVFIGLLERK